MSTARKEIREAIRAKLVAAATVAGVSIYNSRSSAIAEENLPAAVIWTRRESAEESGSAPLEYEVEVQATIELFMAAADDDTAVDDQVDDFCQEIKDALYPDPTLGGKADKARYRSTDYDQDPDGEKITGAALMTWSYWYHEDAVEATDASLSDLSSVHVEFETDDSVNVKPEIEDDFTAP